MASDTRYARRGPWSRFMGVYKREIEERRNGKFLEIPSKISDDRVEYSVLVLNADGDNWSTMVSLLEEEEIHFSEIENEKVFNISDNEEDIEILQEVSPGLEQNK